MKKHLATLAIAVIASAIVHAGIQLLLPARADQSERVVPTSGIYTGPEYAQLIGDLARSVSSANKGSSAPANVSGVAVDGLEWLDDSVTPWVKKRYVNGGWAAEAAYDPSSSSYVGYIGGGLASIASSSLVDLGSVPQANVSITGTATIAGFGSSAPTGIVKIVRFAAALTLTYSSALPVPCGYDLVTAANDRAIVTHLGSGNWEFTAFTRASGIPIDCAAVAKIEFAMAESVPALHVAGFGQALTRASYPAYLAKVTRAQNGTRTSGNATIAGIANTTGMGAGMPVEGMGIAAGCTIASVVANTSITLNSAACVTSSGTSTVTVFLTGYGAGGSSSTVGAPDCRGRSIAGRDRSDPGSLANRLTSSYFGADASVFNVAAGAESRTLTLAQLPTGITSVNASQSISVTVTAPGGGAARIAYSPSGGISHFAPSSGGGGFFNLAESSGGFLGTASLSGTTSNSISVTSNNTSGSAHATASPALIAECVIRVTP